MTGSAYKTLLVLVSTFLVSISAVLAQSGTREADAAVRASNALRGLNSAANAPVFGSQLFAGDQISNRTVADPRYTLQRGDRIAVRAFGAYNADFIEQIDQNGVLFIPQVGPVSLAGRRAGELRTTVEAAVRQTFTENVRVYATLLAPGSIGVYVSGDVNLPGRYTGTAADDLLYYLQAAGGINLKRGSFRDLRVVRNGEIVEQIDLYEFLLEGTLPSIDFMSDDVIFVGQKGPTTTAVGVVLAPYTFELRQAGISGADILRFARPRPSATHVALTGSRSGEPFTQYLSIGEFHDVGLADGDQVDFRTDVFGSTIAVAVQSTSKAVQALYILPREAQLIDLLGELPIDYETIDASSIHVNRQSVAAQQKKALNESLDRLERAAALGNSFSAEAAQVQRAEAEIIQGFVERARQAQPSGTITVVEDGELQDLTLQDGDVLVLPEVTDVVLVAGEVIAPGAFVASSDDRVRDYIRRAGGFQDQAHKRRFVVLKRSGAAIEVGTSYRPQAGDQILVLPRPSNKGLLLARELTQVVFQLALSTATVARL